MKNKFRFFFLLSSRDWTEVADLPARDHSYTIPNLNEGEEVSFRIIAVNDVGPSEPSRPTDAITVQAQPGRSIKFPFILHSLFFFSIEKPSFLDLNGIKDITVKAGKDFEVHIPYKATPKAQAQWLFDDKDLLNNDRVNLKVRSKKECFYQI
jgi:hypothetical protein